MNKKINLFANKYWDLGELWHEVLTFVYKPYYWIKDFFYWVVKVSQYAKILWKDYDWDFVYILILLKYKLERTRKCIAKHNHLANNEEVVSDILKAEKLLEKIINDDFYQDSYKEHETKWGKTEFGSKPHKSGHSEMIIVYENKNLTKKQKKQERKEILELYKNAEQRKSEAMDELFQLLRNRIEYWWD